MVEANRRKLDQVVSDPIALQILWTRLIAVADEAATTLVRASFSPVVRESNDFSCAIFDRAGNVLAENTIGIPSFNMTMQRTLEAILRWRRFEEWEDGDIAITNDPWLATGHLPDITMVMPIFSGGELIGWTGNVAHMADIGGSGWRADSREIYEEGLFLPPVLLFRRGEACEEIVRIIRSNVRMPEEVLGDLMAMVAANRGAAAKLDEIVREAGIDDLEVVSRAICGRSEQAMRDAIANLPDGTYRGAVDMDGTGQEAVRLCVSVTVEGDRLTVDYEGTSPQVMTGLNTVMNYTEAYTCYPIKCALDPATPRNSGSYRPIEVKASEGSILNPRFPAPVNARQIVGHMLAAVLYEALADAAPDRVIAESGSAPTLRVVVTGRRDDGRDYNTILFVSGGMGARPTTDGLSATCFPSMVVCGSMEVLEVNAPIRVWRKEFAVDSGGPGQYRGGLGQSVELEVLGERPARLSLFVDRVEHPARGMKGGKPGGASYVAINGSTTGFPLKGRSSLEPGDRISVRYPGGGGFGDPALRERRLVQADYEAGLISHTAMVEGYT